MRIKRTPLIISILALVGLFSILTWWYNNAGNKIEGFYGSGFQLKENTEQEFNNYILSKLIYKNVIVMVDDSLGLDNYNAFSYNVVFEPILILRSDGTTSARTDSFTVKKAQIDAIRQMQVSKLPNKNIQSLALLVDRRLELFEIEKGRITSTNKKAKKTFYVKPGGTGNGNSWSKATGDLQSALKAARKGDQIWVAAGKYLPTKGTDRTASFKIPDGVKLYGGFAGTEKELGARDWRSRVTILSGEIGTADIKDNSYTVVLTKNVSTETVIDGFTITGGAANGVSAKGTVERCGGGWFNDGSNGVSNPTIVNCIFTKNYGRDGAGLYNYAQKGSTNPTIQNCIFTENRADLDGGAIHNDGSYGIANPNIEGCIFQQNEATYGAGICNTAIGGEAKPVITNCDFIGNLAYIKGGSIFNSKNENGITEAIVQDCRFDQNASTVGKSDNIGKGR